MPFCSALHNHIAVGLPGATWKPCCRFRDTEIFNVNEYSIDQYRNTDYFKQIVSQMEDGWHDGCIKCKQEEHYGKTSYRQRLNNLSTQTSHIEYIEISVSNECNLACRMCGPVYSTRWQRLLDKHDYLYNTKDTLSVQPIDFKIVFDQLDLKYINRIKYLGGEPFVTEGIKDLFDFLDYKGIINNITFIVNTNCTLFPEKLVTKLSKFKKIWLTISIDGYGSLNDYIRDGKSWSVVENNLLRWKQYQQQYNNIDIDILTTVQAYNIHDLGNIKQFADQHSIDHNTHMLLNPKMLSINVLPNNYIESIKNEHNIMFINTIKNNQLFNQFKNYTLAMDKATGKLLEQYIPSLYKYF